MARQHRPGGGCRRRRLARAGRGRLSRRRGTAPGLPRPWRGAHGATPRPALPAPTRGRGPASPWSRPRRRRAWAGQGRALPPRRDPTPRRGSPDRRKSVAPGPMARGPEVRPAAGQRQTRRARQGNPRSSSQPEPRFPTPRRRQKRPPECLWDAQRGPLGRISRLFPLRPSAFRIMSDNASLSDIATPRQAGRIPRHTA